jgi:hypothetical protein
MLGFWSQGFVARGHVTAVVCKARTLLLPEYSSRDKLQRKLMTAIQNAQGFGLQ